MKYVFVFFTCIFFQHCLMGQSTASRTKKILVADSVDLDSLSIYPNSFEVYYQDSALPNTAYKLDFTSALFVLNETL
ncbi:MAG: hypothetical protein P8K10_05835, partial [Crocinitomicaceae bacterium]|nr:hypothetical protein [Crocinitomicaceae bacterium]